MAASLKIMTTKDYAIFGESGQNRPVDLTRHRQLEQSMQQYGFIEGYPLVCFRDRRGNLIVKDGQHRLAIARSLGIPVFYVVVDTDFDVPMVNATPKPWTLRDYALVYQAQGKADYGALLEFATAHSLPLSMAASMLAGVTCFNTLKTKFMGGEFRITDRAFADRVAVLFTKVAGMASAMKNIRFLSACMAVCRVPDFDLNRLLSGARQVPEKLVGFSTQEAYLGMMEELYNYNRNRKSLFGLKAAAMSAMRDRNPMKRGKGGEEAA